jgi:AcrR family transcriptional regulator
LANREIKLLAGSIGRVPVKQEQTRAVRLPRSVRRAQLLDAALEVFTSQGYHSAAMDDIAERAGVSKPVLYQHFPSKMDLYLALLDSGAEDLIAKIKEALESTRDNRMRVTAAIAVYFSFVDDSAEAFRLLFETDLFNEEPVRERVQRADDECAALLREVIAEDTGLGSEESTMLAFGLMGMAQLSARRWLRGDESIDRQRAAELVSRMGWRGISGFPRHSQSTRQLGEPEENA